MAGVLQRIRAKVQWGKRLWDWEEARFDRKLGVDTGGTFQLETLTIPVGEPSKGVFYRPQPMRVARWWLRELPRNTKDYTFIDMGSGKGRLPLLAAQRGFRHSVGIEYAEELHWVALENARIARTRGLAIEPIFGDAGDFEFPPGPLVVNFANPFFEPVMERVIANLTAAYENSPRPVVVIYQEWYEEPERTKTRNLELLEQVPFLTGRRLVPQRFLDRKLLQGYIVGVFESPEVNRLDAS